MPSTLPAPRVQIHLVQGQLGRAVGTDGEQGFQNTSTGSSASEFLQVSGVIPQRSLMEAVPPLTRPYNFTQLSMGEISSYR